MAGTFTAIGYGSWIVGVIAVIAVIAVPIHCRLQSVCLIGNCAFQPMETMFFFRPSCRGACWPGVASSPDPGA